MADWTAFAGVAGVVLSLLLLLSRLSEPVVSDAADRRRAERRSSTGTRADPVEGGRDDAPAVATHVAAERGGDRSADTSDTPRGVGPAGRRRGPDRSDPLPAAQLREAELTTGALLANVAVSQGLFASLLVAAAWLTAVPPSALGLSPAALGVGPLSVGALAGVALYLANETGAAVGEAWGFDRSEGLRAALTPGTPRGWAALLFVVLPVIAGFEELLFRGVLVGALATGFGLPVPLLVVASSAAFAVGHGAQGTVGAAVTGLLGLALAAVFVLTGSLLSVVVAHYLVNALEFIVHGWADVEFGRRA